MIYQGDCLEVLKTLESNSVDSLVTDPPAGISFMGANWDHHKGGRKEWIKWMTEVMTEAMRVMKPGAHGLVWALPRTSHWTATALEDAGFEVRDVVTHLFGTGFPKSLDISKAIDKAAGAERVKIADNPNARDFHGTNPISMQSSPNSKDAGITAPATPEAKQWQGWGTALKPASEHWILVRKPCSEKAVAANVLKHGTGGINIEGCRIGVSEDDPNQRKPNPNMGSKSGHHFSFGNIELTNLNTQGRFPANLVLDEIAAEMLDKSVKGRMPAPAGNKNPSKIGHGKNVKFNDETIGDASRFQLGGDPNSASRFFYVAKASKADRNAGLEGMPEKPSYYMQTGSGKPSMSDGHTGKSAPRANFHPTVKSTKLMDYLIKLVTPPGGTVLDPFMGSGSTGVAAKAGGWKFVGIEQSPEYFEIAEKRIR